MSPSIPFYSLEKSHRQIKNLLLDVFKNTIEKNDFILGENVKTFETKFANFINSSYAVGVSNGLDALFLSLRGLGISDGDEVIIPSHTYIATALAVTAVGATPIFVECDPDSFNINPNNIESKISEKTKCIIVVHLYGNPAEMDQINSIAKRHNIKIIEDNSQAQGAKYKNRYTGTLGDAGATSLYPGKNLGALGDAGIISTNDKSLFEEINHLRNYGSIEKYDHQMIGFNMRLDEIQAAFLNVKLDYLEDWNTERREIAEIYNKNITNSTIQLPVVSKWATPVYHQYVVKCKKRDELANYLRQKGINTLIHYPTPIHLQKAYRHLNLKKGDLPVCEKLANEVLSLPVWPGLKEIELDYIVNTINKFR